MDIHLPYSLAEMFSRCIREMFSGTNTCQWDLIHSDWMKAYRFRASIQARGKMQDLHEKTELRAEEQNS
jgi:hypothetical protein